MGGSSSTIKKSPEENFSIDVEILDGLQKILIAPKPTNKPSNFAIVEMVSKKKTYHIFQNACQTVIVHVHSEKSYRTHSYAIIDMYMVNQRTCINTGSLSKRTPLSCRRTRPL